MLFSGILSFTPLSNLVHSVFLIISINFLSIGFWNPLISIVFLIPFLATSLALLHHNWYPSRVFVGDTYTNFAGMIFAVVGILSHYSKTMMLFFIPQILNFIYSMPQLFGYVKCPRHRIPRYNPEDKLLYPSRSEKDNEKSTVNLTLLNLALQIFGPMSERNLCIVLVAFQLISISMAFFIRYHLSYVFY